jgi:hypothetical protein
MRVCRAGQQEVEEKEMMQYRQVLFYSRVTLLENITQIEHKIPI